MPSSCTHGAAGQKQAAITIYGKDANEEHAECAESDYPPRPYSVPDDPDEAKMPIHNLDFSSAGEPFPVLFIIECHSIGYSWHAEGYPMLASCGETTT